MARTHSKAKCSFLKKCYIIHFINQQNKNATADFLLTLNAIVKEQILKAVNKSGKYKRLQGSDLI